MPKRVKKKADVQLHLEMLEELGEINARPNLVISLLIDHIKGTLALQDMLEEAAAVGEAKKAAREAREALEIASMWMADLAHKMAPSSTRYVNYDLDWFKQLVLEHNNPFKDFIVPFPMEAIFTDLTKNFVLVCGYVLAFKDLLRPYSVQIKHVMDNYEKAIATLKQYAAQ